jgi:hypothetical protein
MSHILCHVTYILPSGRQKTLSQQNLNKFVSDGYSKEPEFHNSEYAGHQGSQIFFLQTCEFPRRTNLTFV